jgi:hypothetical protein
MAITHKKVRYSPKSKSKEYTPVTAAHDAEQAFKVIEGRWKLLILFHLFGGKILRFSGRLYASKWRKGPTRRANIRELGVLAGASAWFLATARVCVD